MKSKLFFKPIRISALLITSVFLVSLASMTYAETEVFVVTSDPGYQPYTNYFKLRDGIDATVGLKVQRVVSGPSANNKYAAPTTNIVLDVGNTNANILIYGNGLPSDCQDYIACRTWIGDDDAATGATDAGNAGFVSALIGSSDTTRHGWFRAFSSTRLTNSAYYGDSKKADTALASGGAYNYQWDPSDPVIENVNPAYDIPIDSTPTNGVTYGSVVGSVFATDSGANNQLESGFVLVEWRHEDSSSWTTGDSSLSANGNFDFAVNVPDQTNIYVRARVKNANTPRNGFPFSKEFLVNITATPPTPDITITAPNGGNNYTANIGVHSTNIVGTIDLIPDTLVWTNSLDSSGGVLTSLATFDFSAGLILGVNPITIYATRLGITGTETITITVNNPAPPSVTITTGNILTNGWPVTVSGTSSGADSVLISNTVTAATAPCTGTDVWNVDVIGTDNTAENYVAIAYNIGGHTVSVPIEIDHDNIAPTVGQTAPVNNYTTTSANVTFTFTAVDDRHSVATTQINFDSSNWQNFITGSSETFAEGIHTWEIRATDDVGSGNTSTSSGTRVFYYFEQPSVAYVNPVSSGTYITNGVVDMILPVDGTVTDGSTVVLSNTTTSTEYIANVVGGTWDVANVVLARGNNILIVRAKRNDIDSPSAQIIINNQQPDTPVVAITDPNGGNDYSINIGIHSTNIVGTVDLIPDSLVWSNSLNSSGGTLISTNYFDFSTNLFIGVNTITVYATKLGVTGSNSINITVSNPAPPSVTITTGNILTNGWPVTVSGTSSGADSVLISNTVTAATAPCTGTDVWNVDVIGTDNTAENYVAIAYNIGGHTVSVPIEIDHDNIAPTVGQTAPVNNYTTTSANVTFTFTAVDDRHSVATTQINFDSSNWQNFITGSSETFAEGIHTWEIRATDDVGSGNTSTSSGTRVFYYFEQPSVAYVNPVSSGTYITNGVVDMILPVDGTVTAGSTVVLSNTTTSAEYIANVLGGTWNVTNVVLARGNNILIVRAKRNGIDSPSAQIIINNQQPGTPNVTITDPNGGIDYSISIGIHSTNIVGIIDLIPDSLVWSNSLNSSGGTLIATNYFDFSTELTIGVNTVTVYATKSGIRGSGSIIITVNPKPSEIPIITITAPNEGKSYIVKNGVHSTNILGNVNIIPDTLVWSNLLNGAGGNIGQTNIFDFSIDLTNGQNTIVLYATKGDKSATDFIVIGVTEPNEILVVITEPNGGIDFNINLNDDSFQTNIAGLISSVPDTFSWTNSNGSGASLLLTTNIFDFLVTLNVGTNVITVLAEKDAKQSSDVITIIVIGAEPLRPYIEVVSPTNGTRYSAAQSISIAGVATGDVVSITRNGTDITANYTNPDWTDSRFIGFGTNTFTYVATDGDGNSATDTVSYIVGIVPDEVSPYIEVTSPTNFSVYPLPTTILITGVATDGVAVVEITRNDSTIFTNYTNPNWTDSVSILQGTNIFTYIATDGDGNSATDTVSYIVDIVPVDDSPYIEVISPTNFSVYPLPTTILITGVATDDVAVVEITRNNSTIFTNYTNPNWTDLVSIVQGTNTFTYVATDGSANTATDIVRFVVLSNEVPPVIDLRILEVWPRFIGAEQTGTVEFVSASDSVWNLYVVNHASSNTPIASGTCTAGWNLVDFYGGNLPIDSDNSSNILKFVVGTDGNSDSIVADAVTVVDDLALNGLPTIDFDGDLIYIKYVTKAGGKIVSKGRSLYIEGGSPKDRIIIKVKAAKGYGDGVAALCGIISDNSLNAITVMGDLDRLQIDGTLNKLMLKGGSLGRPNATVRYNARFNALQVKSKAKIMLKAGKNKTTKTVLLANCYANILAGELKSEPNNVEKYAGLKMLKINGGNLGVKYDDINKLTFRHWLSAIYADIIMVKPKASSYGGDTFDYSFYFTGESKYGKGSFKTLYLYKGVDDSSANNNNSHFVCGYDEKISPLQIIGMQWTNYPVAFSFNKIMTKAGVFSGTVVIKNWMPNGGLQKQFKGIQEARWIIDGKED